MDEALYTHLITDKDKLPEVKRVSWIPAIKRANPAYIAGGITGAALAALLRKNPLIGALIGFETLGIGTAAYLHHQDVKKKQLELFWKQLPNSEKRKRLVRATKTVVAQQKAWNKAGYKANVPRIKSNLNQLSIKDLEKVYSKVYLQSLGVKK